MPRLCMGPFNVSPYKQNIFKQMIFGQDRNKKLLCGFIISILKFLLLFEPYEDFKKKA